jgi:hypothetical protein
LVWGTAIASGSPMAKAADVQQSIAVVKELGPEGKNHLAAMKAWRELAASDPAALPAILKGMQGANPLAANWLLGAFESICDRTLTGSQANGVSANSSGKLPQAEFEAFVKDITQHPSARRIAFEWLSKVDSTAGDRLIPSMLLDPSPEFRRDAVARLIDAAQKAKASGDQEASLASYTKALEGAIDDDQVKVIAEALSAAGKPVDLQQHFGFITKWNLIGPFDNTNLSGFDVAYPPESQIDLSLKYPGKELEVGWIEHATTDEYGVVDLRKAQAHHKGAISYASTMITIPTARSAQLRLGTPNAWKLWVNGQLVFARDEYHRGTFLDQYSISVDLVAGANSILLKVCQNEQTEEWAQEWQFQLRACDTAGARIEFGQ